MKKFSLFNKFSSKGVSKDDEYIEAPTNFKGFFIMLGRKFWNISNLNLVYTLCNIPVFFLLFNLFTHQFDKAVYTPASPMYAAFYGIKEASENTFIDLYYSFTSGFSTIFEPTTMTYVFYGIGALTIITFGLSNAGAAYCIRGYNRCEPVFLFSDFFGTIKKNFLQALIMGVLDLIIIAVLFFDYTFWMGQPGFINAMLMYFALFLCVLYFMMRFYIYTLLITFKLSVFKIFKNALILTLVGIKRNLLAFIGIVLVVFLNFALFMLYAPIGIMLPLILTICLCMFIAGYASYPVIKKYMIDPFYAEQNDKKSDEEDKNDGEDDVVFEDRG